MPGRREIGAVGEAVPSVLKRVVLKIVPRRPDPLLARFGLASLAKVVLPGRRAATRLTRTEWLSMPQGGHLEFQHRSRLALSSGRTTPSVMAQPQAIVEYGCVDAGPGDALPDK